MAILYTRTDFTKKVTVGTGTPASNSLTGVAGDEYRDITSGIRYYYTTEWSVNGIGASIVSNSNATLAAGSSITVTSPSTIKSITAQFIEDGIVKNALNYDNFSLSLVKDIQTFTADAIRQIEAYATDSILSCKLTDGKFAIMWRTGNIWKVGLWSDTTYAQIGSTVTLESSAPTATYHHGAICALSGNKFCVMWSNSTGSNILKYAIYDNTCTATLSATNITTANGGYHACCETAEGNIMFAYAATYSQYTIWNTSGTQVQAPTQLAATGTGRGNGLAKLTNNFIVFINEGATSTGRYAILDTSTNPATVKVSYTEAIDNWYGIASLAKVHALPDKNFVITSNDESSNEQSVVTYQYISDTSWINMGNLQPFTNAAVNVYPNDASSDPTQGLVCCSYQTLVSNNSYGPQIAVLEGRNAKIISPAHSRSYIPYANRITATTAVTTQFLDDKRLMFMWRDIGDASKGKFVVYQIEHFKISVSGLVVTLKNNTNKTQNVLLSVNY